MRRLVPMAQPVLGEEEIEAVVQVLRSGRLVQGELVERFERRFAAMVGVKHAVAVSSGTAALHLALLAHGIGPGDEVITTPFTFIATANAVLYTGARPVFVDIDEESFNIDPELTERSITPRTRAVVPVHLYGNPADMSAILDIASRRGLHIIEDCAQAHGAMVGDRQAGSFGTGCFSFYATKNITTAEGGMITTNDDALAERLRMLRSHGQRERYRHEVLGYNYRLTDLQAAIGLAQLDRLAELTEQRIANAAYLSEHLRELVTPRQRPFTRHVYHQYTVRVSQGRDRLAHHLAARGVETAVHYPCPVHRQKLYLDLGYRDSLPRSERASREVLSLPVHPALTREDLDTIVEAVREFGLARVKAADQ